MIKFENTVTPSAEQWKSIIFGARNPLNSWGRSDTLFEEHTSENWPHDTMVTMDSLGPNDLDLMKRLRNAGTDHRKFMRMITVYVDITAPLYLWKEFDTYKVGTVANSCSTMHKIHAKEFTLEDFSCEHLRSGWSGKDKNGEFIILPGPIECLENTVIMLNRVRDSYLEACKKENSSTGLSAKDIWWQMIQLLPSSYNQKRTVLLNYEVLANMYKSRKDHRLDEWHTLCDWIKTLPYSELITGEFEEEKPND